MECARSRETVKRSQLADAADYGYCAATPASSGAFGCTGSSRPTGPRGRSQLASPKRDEREVGLELLAAPAATGHVTLIGDKGYAGREFAAGRQ